MGSSTTGLTTGWKTKAWIRTNTLVAGLHCAWDGHDAHSSQLTQVGSVLLVSSRHTVTCKVLRVQKFCGGHLTTDTRVCKISALM